MQSTSPWKPLLVTMIIPVVLAASPKDPTPPQPTLVELWRVGDDGLTLRLTDAIRDAFDSAPDFLRSYSDVKKPGTLIVLIPTHVKWEDVGKRTKVIYTVEFLTVDRQEIGTVKGWCWDGEYAKCAAKVMKAARLAARKVRQDERKSN